jgi:hypothetical protein
MKISAFFLGIALFGAGASGQIPRTTAQPNPVYASTRLQLTASVESATVKMGAPVVIKLRLRNVSAESVTVVDTAGDVDNELFVTDASGKEMDRTPRGKFVFEGIRDSSASLRHLDPGQEIETQIDVKWIYELKQPGTYYVQVLRNQIVPDPSIPRPYANSNSNNDSVKIPIEKAVSNKVQLAITP